ncbi:MAG: TnpV protein [Oscillospiraceae bacterium]|nr:TnpV protein [Oscillospiraceae bacterium]
MNELKERIHENGIDYILCGDYYIPDWKLPLLDRPVGRYGRMRQNYLKEHRPALYAMYLIHGTLYKHCADVNEQAQQRLEVMMKQLIEEWGITEDLKARDQMGWVSQMNQAKHCAEETILRELIYN